MAYFPGPQTINVDAATHDAFNRMRVSQPTSIFDNMGTYIDNPLLFESIANGGSVAQQSGKVSVRLSNGGTTAGNYAVRSSKVYHRYQPGKSQLVLLTFTMSAAQTNVQAQIGYNCWSDGFFLERYGSAIRFVRRSSTGSNLVSNGTFTSDTTGWTGSGATLSRTTAFGDGELTVTNSGAANGYAYQAITTEIGKRYVVSAIVRRNTTASVGLGVGTTATGMELNNHTSTNTGDAALRQGDTLSFSFTASGTTTYVTVYNNDTTNGVTGVFDNILVRSVDTVVEQASWNIDTFGAGALNPSGHTLDMTKAQILVIDFQYLGVGRCRMGFDIDGVVYYAHEFVWANANEGTYMGNGGSLPVRASVMNDGTAGGTVTLDWHCSAVVSEGGLDTNNGFQFAKDNGLAGSGAISAERTIIGLRPTTTLSSSPFRGQIKPVAFDLMVSTNAILWQLQLSPVATITWADFNTGYSGAQTTTTVAAVTTPGVVIDSGFIPASNQARGSETKQSFILTPLVYSGLKNTQESVVLIATPLSGNATVNASVVWTEAY